MQKKDTRSLSSEAQEALRVRAVNAVQAGHKQIEVAALFDISRQALGKWLKTYKLYGITGLQTKPKGRRPGGQVLKPWQADQINKAIIDYCPDHFELPFYLWTREAVEQLIKQKCGIKVSVWTVKRYLAKWGFTFASPVLHGEESDDKVIRHWLRQEYPGVRQLARQEKAIIFWSEIMELYSDQTIGRNYGENEEIPAILHAETEVRYNIIYAITNQGKFNFMVFKNQLNTENFMIFINRLIRQANRKIFLMTNSHAFLKPKQFKTWLDSNYDNVRIYFLPGFEQANEPLRDEMLNQDAAKFS